MTCPVIGGEQRVVKAQECQGEGASLRNRVLLEDAVRYGGAVWPDILLNSGAARYGPTFTL
jgi:hypothetical protein